MFVIALAVRADERGHDVHIIHPSQRVSSWVGRLLGLSVQNRMSDKDIASRLKGVGRRELGPLGALRFGREADVVYTKNEPHELLFSALLEMRSSAKIMIGFHSAIEGRPGTAGRLRAKAYRSPFYSHLLRRADTFHVLQPAQSEFLTSFHAVSAEEICKIGNGIDLTVFRPRVADFPDGPVRFLFVGRLDAQKGIDILLEAWGKLPSDWHEKVRLTISGDGPLRNLVETRAAGHDTITYLGHVPEAWRLYVENQTLIAPSRWEVFALVPGEALASGLPVILSDISANSPYLDCEACIPTVVGDSSHLAQQIMGVARNWYEDRAIYDRFRIKARSFAEAHLDQSQSLDSLLESMEKMVD